jgi:hypothetical protein
LSFLFNLCSTFLPAPAVYRRLRRSFQFKCNLHTLRYCKELYIYNSTGVILIGENFLTGVGGLQALLLEEGGAAEESGAAAAAPEASFMFPLSDMPTGSKPLLRSHRMTSSLEVVSMSKSFFDFLHRLPPVPMRRGCHSRVSDRLHARGVSSFGVLTATIT